MILDKNENTNADFLAGQIVLFDKEKNWTSFDLVNKVRGMLKKAYKVKKLKVGHTGTLDPLATGLMVVCTGKATKKINDLQNDDKEYIAKVKLGATTPSFDLETEEDQHFPTEHITKEKLEKALKGFMGEQQQIPPVFSAKRINGKRAYELARKGQEVEMKAASVHIHDIELLNVNFPEFEFRVACSKGTYIRSLARDIGKALESGAYLTNLVRTKAGEFELTDAMSIADFEGILKKMKLF